MGAWGHLTFQDDAACDWVCELDAAADPIRFLTESLTPESLDDYLEYDDGCGILGAAEAIHAVLKGIRGDPPDDFKRWVGNNATLDVTALIPTCITSLQAVLGDSSELNELWAENEEDYPDWRDNIQQLIDFLVSN